MSIIKGDFLGFTFDGVHSSELGIFRVSDGSRYTHNLLPTIQDKVAQIPGSDGMFFIGSYYTQKQINFPIAFDELTEEQLRNLKVLLSDKNIHTLIFDELPYKVYRVKSSGTPNLKYLCFNKTPVSQIRDTEVDTGIKNKENLYEMKIRTNTERVYKGEGQLSFVSYTPFARSRYKYLDQYVFENIPEWGSMDTAYSKDVYYNYYEWEKSSRMVLSTTKKKRKGKNEVIDKPTTEGCMIYNAGDIEAPFKLKIWFENEIGDFSINYNKIDKNLDFEGFKLQTGKNQLTPDAGVQINSYLNLIEGIDADGALTGTIYNKHIVGGDFFKIPPTLNLEWIDFAWKDNIPNEIEIEYDYLYY